ncbi:DNA/RNA helicase domain-containing protein [Flavobacterium sp.]|uniref:DNA/RNA helicase domain-containing protein n=1 Tax=Flavobacterium sp. TaxID=239 RepID=UPI002B4B4B4E|nr:DNA/RNA helicase domain-containing protein [Flavobacterium sp.]HLF52568.1 DNA/RNA helicase domain-containing protein [Flavobacterium sp.]
MKFKIDGSTKSMYVLHSLFTNHHIKNISGELDFLVLAPNEGFFSIEVKHGGISRKNGDWCFTDRNGKTTIKKTGPFAQQSATMNSVRNYVLNKIKHKKELHYRFSRLLWGTGVAFTSMKEFIDFGPEGHSWQVLSEQGLSLPIGTYISTLSKGSHNESTEKYWYDINKSRPTKKDCEELVNILRGDFEINYSEINKINDNEILIEEYTKEQFALLDFVNYNQRCLIEGSAGTGKTIMALEIVERKTRENLNVGLFCFNNQLGDKLLNSLQNQSENISNIKFVGTLHSYITQKTDSIPPKDPIELQKYYSEDLPIEFLINNENILDEDKLDMLVIDEAQDLITPYYIEVFDSILKGGIRNGNWIMFGDFSNQAIYINTPEKIFELLNSQATYTKFPPLKINCRNTKKIASQNTLLTGSPVPEFTSRNQDGNNVVCKYPSKLAQPKVIEDILLDIVKREIPLNKVTLLSPKRIENSVIGNFEPVLQLIKKGVQTSTIQGYKGLENTIIILFDFDEITSEQTQRLLYVGISRARQELYLVLDKTYEDSVTKLIQKNYPKLG